MLHSFAWADNTRYRQQAAVSWPILRMRAAAGRRKLSAQKAASSILSSFFHKTSGFLQMILPKERDPRFITVRRGGALTDANHHALALWAASCAEHVLHLFEQANPDDKRPRQAVELTRAWVRGEIPMKQAHQMAFTANAAAKGMPDAAKFAALAAGQAVAVAHVAAHELGAAAYAIRAVRASVAEHEKDLASHNECHWQREQLPDDIRALVLDDQQLRNRLCWFVFDC